MKKRWTILIFMLAGFLFILNAVNLHAQEKPKLLGIMMHAEWCPSCKVLEPKLEEVKPEFKDEGVLFIEFDMTNEFTMQQTQLLARLINLEDVFNENAGKTGYMLLIDPETGRQLGKLTWNKSKEKLINEIRSALTSIPTTQ